MKRGNTMFNYNLEREKTEQYKKDFPEFTSTIEEYWVEQVGFTIEEILPTMETIFSRLMNQKCHIQCRAVLTENTIKQVLQKQKAYHLTLKYYCVPIKEHLLIPNHISINGKFYDYEIKEDETVLLKPMDEYNEFMRQRAEHYFKNFVKKGKFLMMREEKDINREDLIKASTWRSSKLALEQRGPNIATLVYSLIQLYIQARQNNCLSNRSSKEDKVFSLESKTKNEP